MPELSGTKDLRAYVRMFWRWKWLFLFFVIGAPVVAYLLEHNSPKVYKSSVLVGINQTTVSSSINGSGSFSTSNITAIAELVSTTPVADIAAGLLNPPGNPGQIAGEVSATGDPLTNFLTISAEDRSPVRAAAIANAFANAISQNLKQSAVSQVNQSIKSIQLQLAHLGRSDANRPTLEQQLGQLQAARYGQSGGAAILQPATRGSLVTTSLRRTLELALVIGILLGFGAIALAESADRKLRDPDDLERMTDMPLLAAIESSAFSADLGTGNEDAEAFQMLRTALMYFNVDRQLDSILITSAGEKDGKTTVATRLALTIAGAGLDVILVDADLRRAQVSARLGIHSQTGLGSVVAGATSLQDALVEYPLNDQHATGQLRVLPAGPPPPNPSALMSSGQMQGILRELETQSDLVLIDSPAALAVSDPLPLMRSVTGVVIIARMNRTSRQTMRRLQRIIESAQGQVLGVVATGTASGPGYDHYYPNYYHSNGNGSPKRRRLRRGRGSGQRAGDSNHSQQAPSRAGAQE